MNWKRHMFVSLAMLTLSKASIARTGDPQLGAKSEPVLDRALVEEREGRKYERGSLTPYSGVLVTRHANGQLQLRYSLRDGRADGAWVEWYESGAVRLYAEWRAGLGHGVWVYFHPNGEISERSHVIDDIWDGPSEGWHSNGKKAFTSEFQHGVRLSPVQRWDDRGRGVGPWIELAGKRSAKTVLATGWPQAARAYDFAFSADLETLFVGTVSEDGATRGIVVRNWRGGQWTAPQPASFSDPLASEGTPALSSDGRYIYFSSDRHRRDEPYNRHRDLYRVSASSGWREVERITATPAYGEISIALDKKGYGLLWTDRRLNGAAKMSLHETTLIDTVGALPELRVGNDLNDLHSRELANENDPAISADGKLMIFANSGIGGRRSGENLYVSYRTDDGWSKPILLSASVNIDGGQTSPRIINDGHTLAWRQSNAGGSSIKVISLETALGR